MRGLNRSIVALLALLLILCIAVPEMADAAMLRQGSSGEQVKMLQSKLSKVHCLKVQLKELEELLFPLLVEKT